MGIPNVPLGELYTADAWQRMGNVRMHFRAPVERIDAEGFVVDGERVTADRYICALPFERMEAVGLPAPKLEHSPDHRRALVVRSRSHHAAARDAARPHHAVDVQ